MIVDTNSVKKDFRNFLFLCWKHLGLPVPTPVQYDIAQFLQGGPRRSIIEAFRGVGKSWITSAYVVWRLYQNPQKRFLVISASKQRADDFSTFTKRIIAEMPILAHLKANNDQRNSNVAFDVGPAKAAHAPSVKSIGITGQIVGSRADEIIADDIEVLSNSFTQTLRDKLAQIVKEFDAVLSPGGKVIYLGTPQIEDSLYNTLQNRGYECRIWTARIPDMRLVKVHGNKLAPFIRNMLHLPVGTPTDPDRFDDLDLKEREASYGKSGFALQFMLDTSLSDANRFPLKLADFIVTSIDPEEAPGRIVWCNDPDKKIEDIPSAGLSGDYLYRPLRTSEEYFPYQGSVLHIDPSGRGTDETSYCVTKMLNGMIWTCEIGGLSGGYDPKTLKELALIAKKWKVNYIEMESNFGDGMFNELLKPVLKVHYPCTSGEIKHSYQKELRIIDTVEPLLNQHKIVIDYAMLKSDVTLGDSDDPRYCFAYQLTRLTKERGSLIHDDRIDVFAMACDYWNQQIGTSQEEEFQKRKDEIMDKELAKFTESFYKTNGMGSPQGKSWEQTDHDDDRWAIV